MLDLPKLDLKKTEKSIEDFIKNYVVQNEKTGVVVGISGGLDSACVATLSAKALRHENVLGVQMPEYKNPCPEDLDKSGDDWDVCIRCGRHYREDATCMFDRNQEDAKELIKRIGIKRKLIEIGPVVEAFENELGINENERLEIGNIKARVRMTTLYYFANSQNKVVIGTGDKSELLVGYFTKYGDGGADILPIGNLYKTHVRELSKEIGVPEKIINKPPSPGFWKGQTAEGELGIKYEVLDKILYNLVDRKLKFGEIDYDRTGVEYVDSLVKRSSHKRRLPPKAGVVYRDL